MVCFYFLFSLSLFLGAFSDIRMWSHMLIGIVSGPLSLQVPTVIFQKKANSMLWSWSRRRILRFMHRTRLIWGHLDGLVWVFCFSCLMNTYHFFSCLFLTFLYIFTMLLLACLTCFSIYLPEWSFKRHGNNYYWVDLDITNYNQYMYIKKKQKK